MLLRRHRLTLAIALSVLAASGAHAADAPACPASPVAAAAPLAAWNGPDRDGVGNIDIGVAARWTLEARPEFVRPPEHAPPPGSRGLAIPLLITAPGRYVVAIDQHAWIDLLTGNGVPLASAAHAHGPPCSGISKTVMFDLEPGDYIIQLSGTAAARVRLLVAPAG